MPDATRVLIVDDHDVVRGGLRSLLDGEDTIEVVGEAADGNEAICKATSLQPDVVLLDIVMPRCTGLDALVAIREKAPHAKVIIMSVSGEEKDMGKAFVSGARGYLLKSSGINDIIGAIRKVMTGDIVFPPELIGHFIARAKPVLSQILPKAGSCNL